MDEAIKNAQSYIDKHPDDAEALGVIALMIWTSRTWRRRVLLPRRH